MLKTITWNSHWDWPNHITSSHIFNGRDGSRMQVACFSRRPGGWSASLQNLKRFARLVLLKKRHLTSSSEKLERKTCLVSLTCSLDFCVNELFLAGLGEPNWLSQWGMAFTWLRKAKQKLSWIQTCLLFSVFPSTSKTCPYVAPGHIIYYPVVLVLMTNMSCIITERTIAW
jgi:hypothetical protein